MIERIETPDAYTVKFILSAPHGPLLNKLGYNRRTGIVNREAIEQFGEDYNCNVFACRRSILER